MLLLHRGAVPPWPPLMAELLQAMSKSAMNALGVIISMRRASP